MESEKERLIKALETMTWEKKKISTSKEYKLARTILKIKSNIKHLELKEILRSINRGWGSYKRKKFENKNKHVEYKKFDTVNDKKIVVYTCITGNYDKPIAPLYCNDNVDYILYTNSNKESNGWQRRNIPNEIKKLNNNILINRYIKFHPHELFKDYEYSIYIDGNIRSISDLSGFTKMVSKKLGLAMFKHHTRDCIFDEEKVCNIYKKGNKEKLRIQTEQYKKEGFPSNYGMLEGNVIVSDLKNEKSCELLEKWWDEFLKSESLRDQMSLPYVLWKLNYKIDDIGILGNDVYSCPKFEFIQHLK